MIILWLQSQRLGEVWKSVALVFEEPVMLWSVPGTLGNYQKNQITSYSVGKSFTIILLFDKIRNSA
jgi:hypothetical protein